MYICICMCVLLRVCMLLRVDCFAGAVLLCVSVCMMLVCLMVSG